MNHTERSDSAPPKRKRVPRAIREPQMLDAATEVFSQRGFHAASMDEIAARVSVTKPMLYAYFGSKEGLYRATVNRAGNHVVELVTNLLDIEDADERLRRGVDALLDFVFSQRSAWAVVYNERMGPEGLVDITDFRERVSGVVAQCLRDAAAQRGVKVPAGKSGIGSALPYALGLIGSCESLLRWWSKHSPFSQERCSELAHQLVQAHLECYIAAQSAGSKKKK